MSSPGEQESPRPASVTSTHSSFSTASSKLLFPNEICIGEEVKISVHIALEKFRMNEELRELQFTSSLTSTERAYIHRLSAHLDLRSKSCGRGSNRFITVSKKNGSQYFRSPATLALTKISRHQIYALIQRFPLSNKERMDLMPRVDRGMGDAGRELCKTTPGKLNTGVPQVPPARCVSEFCSFREGLPVTTMREKIMKAISNNRVTLICGATGSGKTTQVPQMILDECSKGEQACRIICTQPRRISAVSVADRVAAERGEKLGHTVGYQIRLESRVSPKTLLTYCTNGVLLRTLMGGDGALQTVTHIVVDEIHERDRFCDFLLTALKDALGRNQHLKLILMSAAVNSQLFVSYFNHCPVIKVPGKVFDVQQYFLEDILRLTNFTNRRMIAYKEKLHGENERLISLTEWCERINPTASTPDGRSSVCSSVDSSTYDIEASLPNISPDPDDMDEWIVKEMNEHMAQAWLTGEDYHFSQIINLIMFGNVSADYSHSETSATSLMIAAGRGGLKIVDHLLTLGASVNSRASNGWTALDWARHFDRTNVVELLESYGSAAVESRHDEKLLVSKWDLPSNDRELLTAYYHSFDDDHVDVDLIISLLRKIHGSDLEGTILIFLPGYDEIMNLKERIVNDVYFSGSTNYILFILHSNIQANDLKRIFKPVAGGLRKIILSTNISESSVTIEDVVFVIDSGRVNETTYDPVTSMTRLNSNWISKANVLQRMGRSGRCRTGFTYHLFSKVRYETMKEYQDPEILRHPLQELCLHAKLLASVSCPIADFLAKAPTPPAFLLTRNSVALLKQIDALDPWEDLTEIGHHLTDLPLEPKYGKMILYSVVLKCLDPVLTIACTLAHKDPFILPSRPSHRRAALVARKKLSAGTFSDHMASLRAFQAWQKAKTDGLESEFCRETFVSRATMEMILNMRTQLLGQLRASGFVRARGGGDIRDLNTNSECWAVVKAALLAGHYPNIIRVDKTKKQFTTLRENKARAHPSSVLCPTAGSNCDTHQRSISRLPTDWLIYDEITRSQRLAYVKCNTVVSPITVLLFSGPAKLPQDAVQRSTGSPIFEHSYTYNEHESSDSEGEKEDDYKRALLTLDDWISFHMESDVLTLALNLRQKWHSLFLRRMRSPAKPWSQVDEATIRAVVSVISSEELSLGIQPPPGIGQRPRPMSSENPSPTNRRDGCQEQEDVSQSHLIPIHTTLAASTTSLFLFRNQRSESSDSSDSHRGDNGSPPAHTARFFVMRCQDNQTVEMALINNVWTTDASNGPRLNEAFHSNRSVYLIISVKNSTYVDCYGQMMGPVPQCEDRSCGTFPVRWIKRSGMSYSRITHVCNPWDRDQQIQFSQDGQELEPTVGDLIIQCWKLYGSPEEKNDHGQGDAGEDTDITPTPNYARSFCHRWNKSPQYVPNLGSCSYEPDRCQIGPIPGQYYPRPRLFSSSGVQASPTRGSGSSVAMSLRNSSCGDTAMFHTTGGRGFPGI